MMSEHVDSKCLACGAHNVKVMNIIDYYTAPFGKAVAYKRSFTECSNCSVSIDYSDHSAFPDAIQESERISIKEILLYFEGVGVSSEIIEHRLELPNHQLADWQQDKPQPRSIIALLRIIRAFPWIIEVADRHFAESAIKEQLLQAFREIE